MPVQYEKVLSHRGVKLQVKAQAKSVKAMAIPGPADLTHVKDRLGDDILLEYTMIFMGD